jgi:DNA-binding IscR family transcriptional regulator
MAVHVLAVLAYKEGDPVTSAKLAASVNTNPVIIRRLLLSLQRARLVETRKGAGSGSRLSRSPGRINLAEVYRAVEALEPFASPTRKAIGGERPGTGLGENHAGRGDRHDQGRVSVRRQKNRLTVSFFVRLCNR